MTLPASLIDRLTQLEKEATPGPWHGWENHVVSPIPSYDEIGTNEGICYLSEGREQDLALIVEMRNHLPKLIEVIRVQAEALEWYAQADHEYVCDDDGIKARQARERVAEILK